MEHLISKYLNQELTEEEAEQLKAWIERDPINRGVFENIVGRKNISGDDIEISRERVYEQVMQRGKETHEPQVSHPKLKTFWSYARKVAAFLILGAGLTWIWYTVDSDTRLPITQNEILVEKEAKPGQKVTFQLPDGSFVKLNS